MKTVRNLTAVAVLSIATMAASTTLASSFSPSVQGGSGAGFNSIGPLPQKLSGEQRRLLREVRALRSEAQAVMRRNGGQLPEAERVVLQSKFEQLKSALQRAS
jgi:hypothetical protein